MLVVQVNESNGSGKWRMFKTQHRMDGAASAASWENICAILDLHGWLKIKSNQG